MSDDGQMSAQPVDVPIRDESIRLGQFLKLANLVEHGSEAKTLLAAGLVRVNGEPETRRGRQLVVGDVVLLLPQRDAEEGEAGESTEPGAGEDAAGQAARVATGDVADDLPW